MTEKEVRPGSERSAPSCARGREDTENGAPACRYPMDVNDRLILNLRDISHTMRVQYEGKASQKRILMVLLKSGAVTQKELTERLGIQPGSASEILSKLENAGLIVRTQNGADRRTTDVLLTEAGTALALEAAAQRKKRHEEMFSCLTPEEKTALLSLLEKIRADWECRFTKSGRHRAHGGPSDQSE